MAPRAWPLNAPLAASSRVGIAAERLGSSPLASVVLLALLGAGAAVLAQRVDLPVRVPGHAILLGVLPFALGLALVPRSFAGCVMGSGALAALLADGSLRGGPGWGAATSLLLTGPILDLAVRRARSGRAVYLAFLAGGALANLAAFAVRLGAKLLLHDGTRPLASWWPEAILTYTLCGVIAGLVSAAVWFRFAPPPR
jgi:ABC-type Co2+ transport system permease subunit